MGAHSGLISFFQEILREALIARVVLIFIYALSFISNMKEPFHSSHVNSPSKVENIPNIHELLKLE